MNEQEEREARELSARIIGQVEPTWTVLLAMSEYQAEWLLGCVKLYQVEHDSALAQRMVEYITAQIQAMHERRRE